MERSGLPFRHGPENKTRHGSVASERRLFAAEIESKLARNERIGVFADLTGFEDMTVDAAAKDFRYNLSRIGAWKRFPREAVVTDKQWMRILIKVVDPMLPQIEARSFAPSEKDAAMAWASDLPASSGIGL